MSNYSEKSNAGRRSPISRRHRSPILRPRNSRSRSPHYDHYLKRPLQSRPTNNNHQRYRSRSPRSPPPHYMRQIAAKAFEEDMVRCNPPENNVLAIFGLSKRVIEQDLFDLYRNFGGKETKVIIDKHTGCPKGYGFVYFSKTRDAIIAREKTDGITLFGKPIRVDFSIGERDYSALRLPPRIYSNPREIRDRTSYRDPRERPSLRYIENNPRDHHRLPRESLGHINSRSEHSSNYFRGTSPVRDRFSPYRNMSSSYSSHRRDIERKRVVTPPLPLSSQSSYPHLSASDLRNVYLNHRSRSRTPDNRNKKHHHSGHSRS